MLNLLKLTIAKALNLIYFAFGRSKYIFNVKAIIT